MKIYNYIKIDIDTGEILEEDSYEYDGPVSQSGASLPLIYYVIYYIILAILMLIAYNNLPDEPDVPNHERGVELNRKGSSEPLPIIYGTRKVGGNDIYINTGGYHDKDLRIIQTISEGEIEGFYQDDEVDQIFIDDKKYTKYGTNVSYTLYTGTDTQTYNTNLNSFDNSWTYNLRRTAYIYWKFRWNEDKFRSIPNRKMVVKGIKCYDFRTETREWTDNPVICLYDFMTSTQYGLAIPSTKFNIASWTAAANYCDDQDWHLNICHMVNDNSGSWNFVQTILMHFRGYLNWWDGTYYLKIRDLYEESSIMNITDDNIYQNVDGKAEITITQPSRFDKPDGLKVIFIDENNNYKENYIYLGEQDGVIADFNLPGCTNYKMASNLGISKLERLRLNRIVTGKFRGDCLSLEPGDIVTLSSSALAIDESLMRVTSTNINSDFTIDLSMQYESYDLYDDDYDEDSSDVYEVNLTDPNDYSSIENTSISEETYYYNLKYYTRLLIDFDVPDDEPWFDHVEVWVSTTGDVEANYKHQTNAKNSFYLDPASPGDLYYIVLRPVNIWKVKTPWNQSPKLSTTVLGKSNTKPPSPNVLRAVPGNGLVNLYSEKIYSPDIEHYEFRFGSQWTSAVFLASLRSPNYSIKGIKPSGSTPFTFCLNTRASNDLYGETPQTDSVIIPNPVGYEDYTSFIFDSTADNYFENTDIIEYNEEDYIGIDTTSTDTTGVFISEIYDTGVTADEYYVYVDNELTVTGAGTAWEDQFPSTWLNGGATTRRWIQIFELDDAPAVSMKIWYRATSGNEWKYIEKAELVSGVVTARYFRVEIEITNPNVETRALISSYELKATNKELIKNVTNICKRSI